MRPNEDAVTFEPSLDHLAATMNLVDSSTHAAAEQVASGSREQTLAAPVAEIRATLMHVHAQGDARTGGQEGAGPKHDTSLLGPNTGGGATTGISGQADAGYLVPGGFLRTLGLDRSAEPVVVGAEIDRSCTNPEREL